MYRKGESVRVVKRGGGNCPDVGSGGTVLKCIKGAALVNCGGRPVWCRYGEIRKLTDLDEFFEEWGVEDV